MIGLKPIDIESIVIRIKVWNYVCVINNNYFFN